MALWAFAVAQPLLELLSRNATFFVASNAKLIDLVAFVLLVTFAPAGAAVGLGLLLGSISTTLQRAWRFFVVAFLATLLLLIPLNQLTSLGGTWVLALAVSGGALAAAMLGRSRLWGTFVAALAPGSVVFGLHFLLLTPVSGLLLSRSTEEPKPRDAAGSTIVLVVLDELPLATLLDSDLEIDATLFPNFARLAAGSTWFRNATCSSAYTRFAVPTIFSGIRDRDRARLPIAKDYPNSLFSFLEPTHRLLVSENFTALCATGADESSSTRAAAANRLWGLLDDSLILYAHLIVPDAFVNRLPGLDDKWRGFRAPSLADRRADWLGTARTRVEEREQAHLVRALQFRAFTDLLDDRHTPTLYAMHVVLPHLPWEYLPSGRRYPGAKAIAGYERRWLDEEAPIALALRRHMLQVGAVDRWLGELLDRLVELGIYERALVVVLADHGASFEARHTRRGILGRNIRDIAHVPLFIKKPFENQSATDDRNVETVDILPTIADVLGRTLPWPVEGTSAFSEEPARPHKNVSGNETTRQLSSTPQKSYPLLELKRRALGPHPTWTSVFQAGPRRRLIGLPTTVAKGSVVSTRASVACLEWFADVDLTSDVVPSYVRGSVTTDDSATPSPVVAIALNGTICATADTFDRREGRAEFGALLPEESFVQGRNEVEILTLAPDGKLALVPVSSAQPCP